MKNYKTMTAKELLEFAETPEGMKDADNIMDELLNRLGLNQTCRNSDFYKLCFMLYVLM